MHDYFSWGIPEKKSDTLYTLYSFAVDCFVFAEPDLKIVNQLTALMTGKIDLRIVEISQASNYYHGLIDNTVCYNWSFTQQNRYLDLRANPEKIIIPDRLQEQPICSEYCEKLNKLQDWIHLSRHWIQILAHVKQYYMHENMSHEFLSSFLSEGTFPCSFRDAEKSIHKILYIETNYKVARQKIEKIANQNYYIKIRLDQMQ